MSHSQLTEKEADQAIERVCERLLRNGWIERYGRGHGKLAIDYTEKGVERMNLLQDLFFDEMTPLLTSEEYLGLVALMTMGDQTPEPPHGVPQDRSS